MKRLLLISAMLLAKLAYSQNNQTDSMLLVLDNYMNAHIPDMNSGISKFKNTLSGTTLKRKTFLFDEKPYSKEFKLKGAEITLEKLEVDDEAAEAYGFKYYWEVSIGGSWFLSNIEDPLVAQRLVEILTDLQSMCL